MTSYRRSADSSSLGHRHRTSIASTGWNMAGRSKSNLATCIDTSSKVFNSPQNTANHSRKVHHVNHMQSLIVATLLTFYKQNRKKVNLNKQQRTCVSRTKRTHRLWRHCYCTMPRRLPRTDLAFLKGWQSTPVTPVSVHLWVSLEIYMIIILTPW